MGGTAAVAEAAGTTIPGVIILLVRLRREVVQDPLLRHGVHRPREEATMSMIAADIRSDLYDSEGCRSLMIANSEAAVTRTVSNTSRQVLSPIGQLVAAATVAAEAAAAVATVGSRKPSNRGSWNYIYTVLANRKKKKKEENMKKKILE